MNIKLKVTVAVGIALASVLVVATPALAMNVYVQPPTGSQLLLDLEPSDSIAAVKAKIRDITGEVPDDICLTFDDQFLEDSQTLSDYGIVASDVINQYSLPAVARWSITPDDPVLGAIVHNYLDSIPLHPTAWQLVDGALPQGVTLDPSTGVVDGTFAATGPFSATLRVTNLCGSANITWSGNVVTALPQTGGDMIVVTIGGAIALSVISAGVGLLFYRRFFRED